MNDSHNSSGISTSSGEQSPIIARTQQEETGAAGARVYYACPAIVLFPQTRSASRSHPDGKTTTTTTTTTKKEEEGEEEWEDEEEEDKPTSSSADLVIADDDAFKKRVQESIIEHVREFRREFPFKQEIRWCIEYKDGQQYTVNVLVKAPKRRQTSDRH